jgi:hypothetical protein
MTRVGRMSGIRRSLGVGRLMGIGRKRWPAPLPRAPTEQAAIERSRGERAVVFAVVVPARGASTLTGEIAEGGEPFLQPTGVRRRNHSHLGRRWSKSLGELL